MALYAIDNDDYISASDADPKVSYYCLECFGPVKVRRARNKVPHFYHIRSTPQCRLYSKSEDHLIVQLQLQKMLAAHMEHPFFPIHRISDLLWEKEKIAFEIQCSPITLYEANKRIIDYRKLGYSVVWLLDDRTFNKRSMRSAEEFLRTQITYFFTFQRNELSFFYDQMEIIMNQKRLKKSPPFRIDLKDPKIKPIFKLPKYFSKKLPTRLLQRFEQSSRYFSGDLIDKIYQTKRYPKISIYFEKWKKLERLLQKKHRPPNPLLKFFLQFIAQPYLQLLERLILKVNQ